ncbi:MAG: PAS domain S-box protein [Candidatus Omnitrophota bacterium]
MTDLSSDISLLARMVRGSGYGFWDLALGSGPDDPAAQVWCSEKFWDRLGYEPKEKTVSLADFLKLFDEESLPLFKNALENASGQEEEIALQCRLKLRNGHFHWFEIRGRVFSDSSNKKKVASGALVDIHTRVQAEHALVLAEEKYRSIFENSAVAITVTDEEERIVSWNQYAEKLLGYNRDDLYLKPVKDLYPKEEWQRIQTMELRKKGMLHHLETKMDCKDGTTLDVDISVTVLRTPDGGKTGSIGIIRDIAERKKAEILLKKLSSAIENAGDSVLICDVQGNIEYVNPAFEAITGYAAVEVIGKTPRILKSGKHDQKFYENLWATLLAGKTFRGTLINKKKDGELYHIEKIMTPVRNAAGQISHFVATGRDITERIRIEEELKRAKEEAIAASRAKSDFLANMSHEIRTPMNGIIGMSGLLMETTLTREQMEYTQGVKTSAENLLALINDILDLSKIEAGKLSVEVISFDLGVAIDEIIDLFLHRAQEKKLEVIVRLDPSAPRRVHGDPGRIRQLITNLMGNALKFTDKGHVHLNVECREIKDGTARIRFSVQDTGVGIAEDRLSHIFEKFVQADASTTRKYGGTGLGLTICRELVHMMHGEIGVNSKVGEGSEFWFELPLAIDERQPQKLPQGDLEGIRVIVVDDNAINRRVVHEELSGWGMRVDTFESGIQALGAMEPAVKNGDPYQIAVLDYQMPVMDGAMLARAIKANPVIQNTILVMLTSLGLKGDTQKFAELGFAAYLVKPVKQMQLYSVLSAVWGAKQKGVKMEMITRYTLIESAGADPEEKSEAAASQGSLCRVLLAEDNMVNQQVSKRMLEKQGCYVDVVANGREAVLMMQKLSYDIVFMDCQMPEMDGYEATQAIRAMQGEGKHTPIIAVTANVMAGDREKCLSAGMDDYVGKPVKSEDLRAMLGRWVKKSLGAVVPPSSGGSASGSIPTSSGAAAAPAGTGEGAIDFQRLEYLKEFADDNDGGFVASLFETFFKSTDERLASMRNHLQAGNATALGREGHGMKGSSSNLGANPLAALCKELEMLGKSGKTEGADTLIAKIEAEIQRVRAEYEAKIKRKN